MPLLLHAYCRLVSRGAAHGGGARGEEIVIVQRAVELAADFGGFGAEGGATTLEENHGDNVSVLRVSVRSEPAEARAVFGAGAGLAQDLLFTKVQAQAAGGAILHGAGHAFSDFRDQRANIKLALYARLKADDLIHRRGMLEVIERASVGDGGNQRAELQRSHGNAFTKRAHFADAAKAGIELMRGKNSSMLALNAITG